MSRCLVVVIAGLLMAVAAASAAQTPTRQVWVNRRLADVLRELQRRGMPIVFSSEVVQPSMRVTAEPVAAADRQRLDEVLAQHQLEVRQSPGGVLLVVPRATVVTPTPPRSVMPTKGAHVRGVVVDGRSAAPLSNVLVRQPASALDVLTDTQGRFDLGVLTDGTHRLLVSLVGYSLSEIDITVTGTPLDVTVVLTDGARTHNEEVHVVGDRFRGAATSSPSAMTLSGTDMRELRGVLADDAFRAAQVAPGVSTGNDFRSEFSIRGSDYRRVGLMVDGIAMGWPVHAVREDWAGGSVGLINADTIDNLTLLSGVFPQDRPARNGGWVDLTMREGSPTRTQVHAALGMTSASLISEGPLGSQGRGSWIVATRQSYLQWVLKRLDATGTRFGFGDAFGKLVFEPGPRHHIEVSAIVGRSLLELERADADPNLTTHGTMTTAFASASWRAIVGSATLTQRLGYSGNTFDNSGVHVQNLAAGDGREWSYRADGSVAAGARLALHGGVYLRRRRIDERFTRLIGFVDAPRVVRPQSSVGSESEAVAHARVSAHVGAVHVDLGAASSGLGTRTLSPWGTAVIPVGPITIRVGAGATHQRPPLSTTASTFTTTPLAPESARQFDVELEHALGGVARVVVTAYHRDERDGLRLVGDEFRLRDGRIVTPSSSPVWRNQERTRASGVELLLQRRSSSSFSGWVAYAIARTRVEDSETGERWDGDFDQRHTMNAQIQFRRSAVTSFSAKIRLGSGVPLSGYVTEVPGGLQIGAERNRVRLPVYARVDVRATRSFNFASHRLTLFGEVVNLLARKNRGPVCSCVSWSDAPRVFAGGRVIEFDQRMLPILPTVGIVIDF